VERLTVEPGRCTGHLLCPVCAGTLTDADGSARCAEGHSFDYARSGYLNLTRQRGRRARVGDTAAMVRARAELLATGHYDRLARAVADAGAAAGVVPGRGAAAVVAGSVAAGGTTRRVVAEIGAGTGHHLAAVVERLRQCGRDPECAFGFDLSKAAIDHAARRHPEIRFVVADVEASIPLRDSVADVVLSVFAPRPGEELARVTRPGGELVAAFATPRHLARLRDRWGLMGVREDKLDELTKRLEPWFEPVSADTVEYEVELGEGDARRIVSMGPNAWHDHELESLDGPIVDSVSAVVARFARA
jgi:23S rRNA (guanine745-N1)-methyltransferase